MPIDIPVHTLVQQSSPLCEPIAASRTLSEDTDGAFAYEKKPPESSEYTYEDEFISTDVDVLSNDPFHRFPYSSHTVAHALIFNGENKTKHAWQWNLPNGDESSMTINMLNHIEEIERYGKAGYMGYGVDGEVYYSTRSIHVKFGTAAKETTIEGDLALFAKAQKTESGQVKEPFWGSNETVKKFIGDTEDDCGEIIKGGYDLVVDPDSIAYREEHHKRKPNQNKVMGGSAKNAVEDYYFEHEKELTEEFKEVLRRAFTADLHASPERLFRPEWLHAYGFSLTPKWENPQQAANLGAASAYTNTAMMVLERLAKWMAIWLLEATVSINTTFEMLAASELINKILFSVQVVLRDHHIQLEQEIDPFAKRPVFWRKSDAAQAVGVAHALLFDKEPDSKLTVEKEAMHAISSAHSAAAGASGGSDTTIANPISIGRHGLFSKSPELDPANEPYEEPVRRVI